MGLPERPNRYLTLEVHNAAVHRDLIVEALPHGYAAILHHMAVHAVAEPLKDGLGGSVVVAGKTDVVVLPIVPKIGEAEKLRSHGLTDANRAPPVSASL